MNKRTKFTMAGGFVALLVGTIGAAYLGTRQASGPAGGGSAVQAYVTAGPVAAGTAGASALKEGRITTKSVPAADRPANAVSLPSDLGSRVAVSAVPAGVVLTTDMFADPQTSIGTLVIPPGKRALAVQLQPVRGLAGFAGAGDRIDIFGVSGGKDGAPPGVRLLLQGVDVLNVNGTGIPEVQGQPGSPDLIYFVAVTPVDAERLIYLTEYQKLYFGLVPKGEGAVPTPGVGLPGALGV